MNLRRANIAVALLLVGFSGWLLFEANKLGFGTLRVPQTGFFPRVLAALLLALSLTLLIGSLRATAEGGRAARVDAQGWIRIASALATLIGFALVLERLGFLLSTFLLMVLLLRAVEPQSWARVLAIALAAALTAYFIFAWLLNIPLPAGVLAF